MNSAAMLLQSKSVFHPLVIDQLKQQCRVGDSAPNFSLTVVQTADQVQQVSLADVHGRWLALMFYPRDFSFVCPTELTDFSSKADAFKDRNCALLAVSPDTIESHQEWLQTPTNDGGVLGLRFPLGSDIDGETCRAYGVWREELGVPNRGLFLIDPNGILRYSVVHDLAVGRNATDVLRILDALESGGLCPANWTGTDGVLDVDSMLKPGRVLGNYRIDSQLGRGAFGIVLSARDVRLGRRVALKIFEKQSVEATSKLINEARSAAAIEHPNVCTIHAIDELDGMSTIVMEYIGGGSLADQIRIRLERQNVLPIAAKIASGLTAAHQQGVVHGDLKPANILMRDALDPVIVDFGLARSHRSTADRQSASDTIAPTSSVLVRHSGPSDDTIDAPTLSSNQSTDQPALESTLSQAVTAVGQHSGNRKISGTPAYMSPEQARGEPLSKASDIFSLGMIIVEMLTGEKPHRDENAIAIMQQLQSSDVVRSIAQQVPQEYRHCVEAMLSPDPRQRPAAADVRALLNPEIRS